MVLTKTKPHSTEAAPVNWTTPGVIGRGDGGVISTIRSPSRPGFPHTAAIGGSAMVKLYTDPACSTEIGSGSLNELESETGIEVVVPPDSVTTFYAVQHDPTEIETDSQCSKAGLTYWESSTGLTPEEAEELAEEGSPGDDPPVDHQRPGGDSGNPPAAPHLRILPRARANDNTPQVTGGAPGAVTVKVFNGPSCAGSPVASGSAAEFGAGLTVHVADNSANVFTAVSVAGGDVSVCSDPVSYAEDSTPPHTKITMGPGVKTRHRKVVFRFADITDDPPGTAFLCKVDRKKWKQCNSPFKLRHLRFKRHTLRVRAIDTAGNAEAKATKRRFKVIRG
ncbi:MAG: hypothetical protein ACRDLL_06320 [Solirubrobacterales bacterium]